MAAADFRGPGLDHHQLLCVARDASREQIAQAWRRRAQAEHPDRVLTRGHSTGMLRGVPVPVRVIRPDGVTAAPRAPGPPLRAGPVRVAGPAAAPGGGRDDEIRLAIRLAVVAALALRYLPGKRAWPW